MIVQSVSQDSLADSTPQPSNLQLRAKQSEVDSLKQSSCSSNSASLPRGRSISRKPAVKSNLQSYKLLKRKSQESKDNKSQEKKFQQPPKYPKNNCELNSQSRTTELTQPQRQMAAGEKESESRMTGEAGKFKKKAMTKQEIIEIKQYMQASLCDSVETNSLAGSETPPTEPFRDREQKKSKTQYFHQNEIRGVHVGEQLSENLGQSEKMLVASLREKCKSVDETNVLLSKRLSWLREEIEVHLERQSDYQNNEQALMATVNKQTATIQAQQKQINFLESQLQAKEQELEELRNLVIDLNLKFEYDREKLIAEMELLKSEQWDQAQEREQQYQDKIRQFEEKMAELSRQLSQGGIEELREDYSQGVIEKLISENKYLKMENHMLGRYKEKAEQLKRENKQVSNERDTLKKKIIQSLRKNQRSIEDSSELSSLLSLSITHSS